MEGFWRGFGGVLEGFWRGFGGVLEGFGGVLEGLLVLKNFGKFKINFEGFGKIF